VRPVRLVILLDLAAAAGAVAFLLLAAGAPVAASGRLGPATLVTLVIAGAAGFVAGAAGLLFRAVARPVDRILGSAERLGDGGAGGLPPLGPPGESGGPGLTRAAIAFERIAGALEEERARLRAKVAEVEAANRALAAANETLLRTERLATVGRLAAGIAHEVGNPLGAITGYAELARSRLRREGGAVDPEVEDFLSRVAGEARRIDAVVRDLLDFARPADLAVGAVGLGAAVESSVRVAQLQPRCRTVAVATRLPPDLPRVRADERRLSQVIVNLILNAADAMGGQGRVSIAAWPERDGVVVEVADSGPGIPPEHLPRVFDPFFTTKAPGQGTGLGLAISHRIVESFGGELGASNAPGGGAVFRLRLRAAGGEPTPPAC
jgi:two-component system, NtrC family, sensor kinase